MTSFDATNSVFDITDENNTFTDSKTRYWSPEYGEEPNTQLNKFLELRSEYDIELNVKEKEKRSTRIQIGNRG